jgi:hypothetical protein
MKQVKIPCFPMPETTEWNEIATAIDLTVQAYSIATGEGLSLLIYEPVESVSAMSDYVPSEAPEKLIVIAVFPEIREAIFGALKEIETREPKIGRDEPVAMPKLTGTTTLRTVFRHMEEMPATVLSFTVPCEEDEPGTIFFLRSAFTISEFRREIEKPIWGIAAN